MAHWPELPGPNDLDCGKILQHPAHNGARGTAGGSNLSLNVARVYRCVVVGLVQLVREAEQSPPVVCELLHHLVVSVLLVLAGRWADN